MEKIVKFDEARENIILHNRIKHSSIENKRCSDILKELRENNESKTNYSTIDIKKLVDDILKVTAYYNVKHEIAIVKISKQFGINVYKEDLRNKILGKLLVNGKTIEIYNIDNVIITNKNYDGYFQRYAVAYQLGCFLFEYIGSDNEEHHTYFSNVYYREKGEEKQIRFAMEVLMPEDMFIKQYNIAVKEAHNMFFVITYLSRFFAVPCKLVEMRINQLKR